MRGSAPLKKYFKKIIDLQIRSPRTLEALCYAFRFPRMTDLRLHCQCIFKTRRNLRSPFQNWGKAPCAFMGVWGRCKPPQGTPASQEARSVCLGRNEPRFPWRLCGKTTLAVLRRSRPFLTSIALAKEVLVWVSPCEGQGLQFCVGMRYTNRYETVAFDFRLFVDDVGLGDDAGVAWFIVGYLASLSCVG